MAKKQWFKWTVEFEVSRDWVADGFDLTDERAKEMLLDAYYCGKLLYAYDHELRARVISAPPKQAIMFAQGYNQEQVKEAVNA